MKLYGVPPTTRAFRPLCCSMNSASTMRPGAPPKSCESPELIALRAWEEHLQT
jgi:hypothetical protein